jgi:hypothetical protein
MALATLAAALDDAGLHAQFRAAALKAAGSILTEPLNTPNAGLRRRWARKCLASDGDAFLSAAARNMTRYALATNATIQAAGPAATDASVEATVAAILGDAVTLAFVTVISGDSEA